VKLEVRSLIVPVLAGVVLVLTVQQTMSALQASGTWQRRIRTSKIRPDDPYSRLDGLLANGPNTLATSANRNPFAYGAAPVTTTAPAHPHPVAVKPVVPPPPPQPMLTAIVWDADPQATVRYDGRDYSVRSNSLFSEFRVKSISQTQVTLDRNGETIVLTLRPKGD
jgi:hypothetical protein